MGLRNLTIRGKTDGFGCQLNAKLSGIAFCFNNSRYYRYVHTPFTSVSHGWRSQEMVSRINEFMGIPDNRKKHRINVAHKWMTKVFSHPNMFYNTETLSHIRNIYWSNKQYQELNQITVHIRRGDIQPDRKDGGRRLRHQKNEWYNKIIPKIAHRHPDNYKIVIHSEGDFEEFFTITSQWSPDLIKRTQFKLAKDGDPNCEHNLLSAFHEMVSSKVFVQSKSGMSYTAGIFNEHEVYFHNGNRAAGQKTPLNHWQIVQKVVQ